MILELLLAITFSDGICQDVTDDGKTVEWSCTEVVQTVPPVDPPPVDPPPTPSNWQVYNPTSRIDVTWTDGAYYAVLSGDPDPQQTLWYNQYEGQLDFVELTGNFTVTARGIGIDYRTGGQWEYQFTSLIVWESPGNWEKVSIGKRGQTDNTLEYKITNNSVSRQDDLGANLFPTGKADVRVTRDGDSLVFEWSQPGAESWSTVPHDNLFAQRVTLSQTVRVGLAVYGFSWPDEFAGTADSVVIEQ